MNSLNYIIPWIFTGIIFSSCSKDEPKIPELTSADFELTLPENPLNGQILGTIDASTDTGELSFSFVQENPDGALSLNIQTGQLTVQDASLFDYEMHQVVSAVVVVSNGKVENNIQVLVNLSNVLDTNPDVYLHGVDWSSFHVTNYYKNGEATFIADGHDGSWYTWRDRLIASGGVVNALNGNSLWSNGTSTPYPAEFSAIHITQEDNITYVLGEGDGKLKVAKDGVISDVIDGSYAAIGRNITVYGSDVYVGGQANIDGLMKACYWKNNELVVLSDNESKVEDIHVVGPDIYAAGSDKGMNSIWNAVYWKNGEKHFLTDGTSESDAYAINVNGDDIYVAGNTNGSTNTQGSLEYHGAVWKNGQMKVPIVNDQRSIVLDIEISQLGVVYTLGEMYVSGEGWRSVLFVDDELDAFLDGTKKIYVYGLALDEVE